MKKPKIALFGKKEGPQVSAIVGAVGGEPIVFEIQLGCDGTPSVCISDERLAWDGVDFTDIRALHIRGTAPNTLSSLPPVMNAAMHAEYYLQYLQEQEYQSVIFSFMNEFAERGGLVINPLTGAYIDHDTKSRFYEKLRSNGFNVPRTLTTNHPGEASEFIGKIGKVVVKPTSGVGSTQVLEENDVNDPALKDRA